MTSFVSASEEHTVLRCVDPREVSFGDPILLAPRHVCSTVNLWESFTLIGPKRFDVPWKDLERQGWIATAQCVEVRIPMPQEERLNYLQETYHQSHAQRLTDGLCQVRAGLVFLELVANFEKISTRPPTNDVSSQRTATGAS